MTRRIAFVTGGAGFIGSNIVARLCEDPSLDVVVCDRLREAELGKWRNIAKHPIGDFVAPEAMFDYLDKRWRDIAVVIHMGAVSSTTEPDADKIIHSNFTLSRDLFRWCADHQRRFIYASSAATYGDGGLGFDDQDDLDSLSALRPLNAYGWSKSLFDLFAARQAARDYAPPQWVGLKFFNVYGPNEGHKGGMRSVIHQIWPKVRDGEGVQLFKSHREGIADGGQTRDFVYVRDVANVVAWLVASPEVADQLEARGILYAPDYVLNAGGLIYVALRHRGEELAAITAHLAQISRRLTEIYAHAQAEKRSPARVADYLAEGLLYRT